MSAAGRLSAILSAGVDAKTALASLEDQALSPELLELISQARAFGSPLSIICNQYESFEKSRNNFELEISQAQAVPLATRRLMLWLPGLSLAVGQLVGLNPLAAIGNPLGITGLGIAAALIWAGGAWTAALLKPLSKSHEHPGKQLMTLRMALDSGLGLAEASYRAGPQESIGQLLEISRSTGAPLGRLLEAEIEILAASQASAAIREARQMSIRLLIPLAVTLLPAFLILTLLPMLIGITNR